MDVSDILAKLRKRQEDNAHVATASAEACAKQQNLACTTTFLMKTDALLPIDNAPNICEGKTGRIEDSKQCSSFPDTVF
jgi:hypothetical protein